ncbi:hypothetical protein NDU88_005185 [Pleurodeles waltl]|uniref:Uncharacterized protein n=1 Tax=Pleurodeles waltl TaxID=8319 RepID=A0AAV7VL08_PLEWA|nr:hypothetical protein NDU88_005185 [Pleurodeles waltl]
MEEDWGLDMACWGSPVGSPLRDRLRCATRLGAFPVQQAHADRPCGGRVHLGWEQMTTSVTTEASESGT